MEVRRAPIDEEAVGKIRDEAADVLLYLALLCDALDIDLMEAAQAKIEKNKQRFPVSTSRGIAKPRDEASPQ